MNIPINIPKNKNILIAGAGGGFDFLCGLPLALKLKSEGNNIIYANYSFSDLKNIRNADWINEKLLQINCKSISQKTSYFPELLFIQWYKEKFKEDLYFYCYSNIGIKSLKKNFEFINNKHNIDEIYIIDGGVDGVFIGNEYDMGTPSMDSISIISGSLTNIEKKYYIMSAFGTEGVNKEVSHSEVLERISELIKTDNFFGVSSILKTDIEGKLFIDSINYINDKMESGYHSTIVGSILKSLYGNFGDMPVNQKTIERPIWISPLTSMYWFCDLTEVAKMKLFYSKVLDTDSVNEVSEIIENIRKEDKRLKKDIIPI
jgi:hypothetical protein